MAHLRLTFYVLQRSMMEFGGFIGSLPVELLSLPRLQEL